MDQKVGSSNLLHYPDIRRLMVELTERKYALEELSAHLDSMKDTIDLKDNQDYFARLISFRRLIDGIVERHVRSVFKHASRVNAIVTDRHGH